MDKYILETMTLDDIKDVVEIEKLSFSTPWSFHAFELELTNNKTALYRVIKVNNKVIAYGGMWLLFDEAHVTNIAVHPEFRGCGFGKVILDDMITVARNNNIDSMTLEVRESNSPAINLYKKFDFEEVAVRRGYYQDTNENAIIMWKYNIKRKSS